MPEIQAMADDIEAFAGRWFKNAKEGPKLLVLAGFPGCGKTHTARRLYEWSRFVSIKAWELKHWSTPPLSIFVSWPEITDEFKEGIYSSVADLFAKDFVVIDDIGAEHDPSKNAADKLCQILSKREDRFTVVTTNIIPEEWRVRFDARISDRLWRKSVVIDLKNVPSYSTL